ncbi:XRE family transcriptional regulator [Hyphomicrobium methylovorum]|nr:XRE family transcriptional regulator [Hyphomicrobium methylovorum]
MGVANETIMPVGRQQEVVTKLSAVVGENLRHLRRRNGLSLEQLAHLSGVSRAMLGQIESGKSAPTINLLGRIADALKVSVPSLISNSSSASTVVVLREKATIVSSGEGGFTCRALFPWGDPQSIEIYEVTIAPHHSERIAAHSAGTRKALVVVTGEVEVIVAEYSPARLCAGDAVLFNADTEHRLRNAGATEAKAFLVVTAADGSCSRVRAF